MSGFGSAFTLKAAQTLEAGSNLIPQHALAHRISDKAEAACRRGDQFEKRRKLMDVWAAFCEPKAAGKVVPIKRAN